MANLTHFWKVWLRMNLLTKDTDNDYIAEVSTEKKTLRNEDIARRIVAEGSEIKFDTLLSIINQHDRIIRESLLQGYSVLTGTCQFTPRVTGIWLGSTAKFDPAAHKITLDIIPSSDMREVLTHVGVDVLGVKEGGAYIGLVTDTLTTLTDGSITANDDIRIEGEKIRVVGEAEGNGIFFVDQTKKTATKVTRVLTQNDPKRIICRVPYGLPNGTYTLRIITQYSSGSVLLKEARTIEYDRPLTVDDGRPDIV